MIFLGETEYGCLRIRSFLSSAGMDINVCYVLCTQNGHLNKFGIKIRRALFWGELRGFCYFILHVCCTRTHARTHAKWGQLDIGFTVVIEVLWTEDGFKFCFQWWKSWTVSEINREGVPNAKPKVTKRVKCMRPVFVVLDFEYAHIINAPWYNRNGWLGVKHQVTYLPIINQIASCMLAYLV